MPLPLEAKRALVITRAFADRPGQIRHVAGFHIYSDAACEELLPIAVNYLDRVRDDIRAWATDAGLTFAPPPTGHTVLIYYDFAAFRRATSYLPRNAASHAIGTYDTTLKLLHWFDQRRGPQQAADLQEIGSDLDAVAEYRRQLAEADETTSLRLGKAGSPAPRRTPAEAQAYVDLMEWEARAHQAWLATPEAGVRSRPFRHEAAHMFLFDGGLMAQPAAAWLIEGTATLFERVERDGARVRPAVNVFRLNQLRTWLAGKGAIDSSRPDVSPYSREKIAVAFDLRTLIHENYVTKDEAAPPNAWYARYWAFTYFLAERRPDDLKRCLQQTLGGRPMRPRSARGWISDFEAVFGDDYAGLSEELSAFLVDVMQQDDRRAISAEAAWRQGGPGTLTFFP